VSSPGPSDTDLRRGERVCPGQPFPWFRKID
jgi:hypothetical protein